VINHGRKISVVGLGYVGLPVAVEFARQDDTVGFDISRSRIEELRRGFDRTGEVSEAELQSVALSVSDQPQVLADADFHIVAVPTPIDHAKNPNLQPLLAASELVGSVLKAGDIVVYESTVYPGATEDACVPVLEQSSGLRCGPDFTVGYSPERINPGDTERGFRDIVKVVSGVDAATLDIVASVYESVVTPGVHRAPSIRVAEAAKVIENTQRDLNIALMNELALIFDRLGLDTLDVLAAAATKWNFLPFMPGLVGGHCIGVDPYYLTHRATEVGYHPQVILAGRRINDDMGRVVVNQAVRALIRQGHTVRDCNVTVLGLTFKEDVPDLRNTRVIDVIRGFEELGMSVQVHDPVADPAEAKAEYSITLTDKAALTRSQCIVLAVSHQCYLELGWAGMNLLLHENAPVVIDVKGCLPRDEKPEDVLLWRL